MYQTTAKFNSVCAKTGQRIKKGDQMWYDRTNKKCYHISATFEPKNDVAAMIEAEENARFDRFCYMNNI